jgi:hypothetical protein
MAKSQKTKTSELDIQPISIGQATFTVVGVQPFIYNSVSVKAQRELLLPARKTKGDRIKTLKQDPMAEYRSSVYRAKDGPTALVIPAAMFKKAAANAAIDIGGATKAEMGRLMWIPQTHIAMYGVPQMLIGIMRDAGQARTPRIRTRAIVPQWHATFMIEYVKPNLTQNAVANVVAASGLITGVGDSRPQKGHGTFGQFRLADTGDAALVEHLIKTGAREAQEAALDEPNFYDETTEELYSWFVEELERRGNTDMLAGANDDDDDDEALDLEAAE